MTSTDFAKPVARINWTKRVAAYLDKLPSHGWTAHDDWLLIEAMSLGRPVADVQLPHGERQGTNSARSILLTDAARDDAGSYSLDGREALIKALRERMG